MVTQVDLKDAGDAATILAQIRTLIHRGIAFDHVRWNEPQEQQIDLLDSAREQQSDGDPQMFATAANFNVTNRGLTRAEPWTEEAGKLMRAALLHWDRGRFRAVHRLAAQLINTPAAWRDTLDPDRLKVEHLAKAVSRDIHKMHAFVRFRQCTTAQGEPQYIAWFEPRGHIVRPASEFFRRRFTNMRWAILTPLGSVSWDLQQLHFGPPAGRESAPAPDAGEQLWIAYYESIFNPARIKVAMMKREMPVAYWSALPEVASIAKLLHGAGPRVEKMQQLAASSPAAQRRAQRHESLHDTTAAEPVEVMGLAALKREAAACDRCSLHEFATQTVWGEGPSDAVLMIVGEQPGDLEDLQGRPFVGPAGRLLRETIRSLGWPSEQLYFTNAVKHFNYEMRGKRRIHKTAGQREALECANWLEAEIRQIQPRGILALGVIARTSLLRDGPARADGIPVVCARHPAALLRTNAACGSLAMRAWLGELAAAAVHLESIDSPQRRSASRRDAAAGKTTSS